MCCCYLNGLLQKKKVGFNSTSSFQSEAANLCLQPRISARHGVHPAQVRQYNHASTVDVYNITAGTGLAGLE